MTITGGDGRYSDNIIKLARLKIREKRNRPVQAERPQIIVWSTDRDLRFTSSSGDGLSLLGLQPGDAGQAGMGLYDNFHAASKNDFFPIEAHLLSLQGESSVYDVEWTGRHFHCETHPQRDGAGNIIGVTGVAVAAAPTRKLREEGAREMMLLNQNLTLRVFSAQETERQRIARDLHDTLGQTLTGIQLYAQAIITRPRGVTKGVRSAAEAIAKCGQEIHQKIRNLAHSLNPSLLDELGLLESLRDLTANWKKQHPGIECTLDFHGNLCELGQFVDITVYRVVQESLTNIARHSGASRVSVELRRSRGDASRPGTVMLVIEDNGKGMNLAGDGKGGGVGVSGMKERVMAVGGLLSLRRPARGGLRVEARIPVL
ncbi:MAG: sensor histidine kinase [Sulfuricella sp.]|nr:sensor histidine kinase [Sulfuricella sp.]